MYILEFRIDGRRAGRRGRRKIDKSNESHNLYTSIAIIASLKRSQYFHVETIYFPCAESNHEKCSRETCASEWCDDVHVHVPKCITSNRMFRVFARPPLIPLKVRVLTYNRLLYTKTKSPYLNRNDIYSCFSFSHLLCRFSFWTVMWWWPSVRFADDCDLWTQM